MNDNNDATNNDCASLLELLREPMLHGCEITLSLNNGILWADLQTQAKSHCYLECSRDGIFAHRRYGRKDKVEDFRHLLDLVHDCGHGRSFFSSKWCALFRANGMESPCGPL
jgi:hypothetical protein